MTILVTFLLISLVPVGAGLTSYYFTTRHALETSAVRHLEHLAAWESGLVRNWFTRQMSILKMLANSPEVMSGDGVRINTIFQSTKLHFPQFSSFNFVDTKGKITYSTSDKTDINVSDRSYFKASIGGKEYVSEVLVARTFKLPCIVFSVPVINGGKISGVLIGSVNVDNLSDITGFAMGETGENVLIDRNGNLITIPESIRAEGVDITTLVPAPESIRSTEGFKGRDGVYYIKDDKNADVICITKWLPDLKVLLVTKQDKAEALEDTGGWGLTLSLVAGNGLILLLLPVIWIAARRISRPLVAISTAVNEIASGKLSYRVEDVKANKEIELLARQINCMAESMEKTMNVNAEQLAELEAQKEEMTAQNEELLQAYQQLSQANEGLQQMATTDQLTEICNRRCFMDRLRREILVSLRSNRPLTVLLIDIDHFKTVNDTYGHKSGDQVLKEMVKVVSESIRRSDLLARFGGEEFIVLAPETKLPGGMTLAEKIRAAVARHHFDTEGGTLKITVSIGLAELNDFSGSPEKTEDQLLLTSDRYLYEAKRNGRDRVEGGPLESATN